MPVVFFYEKILFLIIFHQCILWILLIIIMEGMIINECVKAFTLRMNIWEKLKL
ncbi:hypothetical protein EC2726800_3618 [Escherichia coli 2726800]|nr:hypothetical protein ECDEC13C_3451 [Escherichia coli DEC13C]EHX62110.1 hypothetical protein ECDEC13D_3263 [Escherichia coli DEC13D]EHX75764.1 hypothetical protein ECDEC14A_3096 [Escherichia coli DEC14A]EHX86818.1 hypothetical protein ECDEC14C_3305 [Escherichia coli DEC14C]EMX75137.1 hypothetical protein EC2726800_3618 [Escherichia coli 2726800]END31726.1 hypothetical protein EC179100_3330 [Escherichia coli 179100]END38806.1 hypothetical protein EC2854350_3186 [Escherichia coli 2854350]KDW